jgi:NhaA family Na+:H+ antiporter
MKRWAAFLQSDAGSAVPLLLATALALVLANSPLDETVVRLLHLEIARDSLAHWIDDGLMVVFFLLVGMEIKREVVIGELSRPSQVALPVAGALGGILLPAAIYAAFTWGDGPTSPSPSPSWPRSAPSACRPACGCSC